MFQEQPVYPCRILTSCVFDKYQVKMYVVFLSVVKRSADLHVEAKFAQFSGKGITEVDIVNLEDIATFEKAKLQ